MLFFQIVYPILTNISNCNNNICSILYIYVSGYLPQSNEQWHYFLQEYSDERSVAQRNASAECAEPSDWSVSLTWQCVCERMVGTLGPVTAVRLLQEFDIPPAELSSTFFQMCIKQSLIQQQQRFNCF